MGKFDTDVCDCCGRPKSEVTTADPRREHVEFSGVSFPPEGVGIDTDGNIEVNFLVGVQAPLRKPETVEERRCTTPTCKEGIKNAEQSLEDLNDSLENAHTNNDWNELSEIDLNRAETVAEDFRKSFEHEGYIDTDNPQMLEQRQQMFEDRVGEQFQTLEENIQDIEQKQEVIQEIDAFEMFRGTNKMSKIEDIRSNFSDVEQEYQNTLEEARTQTAVENVNNEERAPKENTDPQEEVSEAAPEPSSSQGTDPSPGHSL